MIDFIAEYAGMSGLLFFFLVFTGIAFFTLKPANKKAIEAHKYIPLTEDSDGGR